MEYTATSSLLELPSELTLELVATIPVQQVVVLMRACSQLNALLSGDQLWRGLALRDLDVLRQLVDYYATNKAVHQPTGWLVLYRSYASLPSAPPPIKFRVGEGTIAETTTSSGGTTYESGGTTYFLATHLLIEALLPLPEQVKLSQFVFTFVVEFEGAEGESLMLRKVCSYDQVYTENTEPWSHDSCRQPGGQLNLIDSTCMTPELLVFDALKTGSDVNFAQKMSQLSLTVYVSHGLRTAKLYSGAPENCDVNNFMMTSDMPTVMRLGFQDVALTKKFQQVTSDISEVWALTARPELTYEVEVEDEDEDEDEGEGAGEENLRISSYRLDVACPFGWILDQNSRAGWEDCVKSDDLARALHDLVTRSMGEASPPLSNQSSPAFARLVQLEELLSHDQWEPVAGRAALWAELTALLSAFPNICTYLVPPEDMDYR